MSDTIIRTLITRAYSRCLGTTLNIFDVLIEEMLNHHENIGGLKSGSRSVSLSDLKERNTKAMGDLWESFCLLYLTHVKGYTNVYLLKDIPDTLRESLGLRKRDIGIDMIAQSGESFVAVQAKFKRANKWKSKTNVGWKELSTFYSLCARSGPWKKHIVMFNQDYVSHMGYRDEKDLSYCVGTFRAITKEQWELMCGYVGHTVNEPQRESSQPSLSGAQSLTLEQLREARLRKFNK